MKLFGKYLKDRARFIFLLLVLCTFFAVFYSLAKMPENLIIYGISICLVLCLIWGAVDFKHWYTKIRKLKIVQEQILLSIENLPECDGEVEKEYHELIRLSHEGRIALQNQSELKFSEALDYFTIWAHQVKTPISAIHLLMDTGDGEYSPELREEVMKIEQYVEMLLFYLRLDSDYSDYVLKSYELDGIIKQAVRKYSKQFIRKKISLKYEGTELSTVTDEKWLLFVICQILDNALKYTPSGSISISTKGDSLIIADTGIGIAPEDLPRVFQKGYTGYNGRYDRKSTGIGLYICKRVLNKLGHEIEIKSELKKGTEVIITFKNEKQELPYE